MKLYIGGVYQGQEEVARAENPDFPLTDFHEAIRRAVLEAHQDPREFAGSSAPRTRTPSSSRTKSARASCRL